MGGGMRGYYAAVYLSMLSKHYAETRGVCRLDLGKGFDLICGTSTGAILACALATGSNLDDIATLYRTYGHRIFETRISSHIHRLPCLFLGHRKRLKRGAQALEKALVDHFGATTVADVWAARRVALTIPAVNMSHHQSWVFKTPHLTNSRHRDDQYRLVDVCLATTAAPIYRSMARLKNPTSPEFDVFVDGGLWANSPVLVGLIDALAMSQPSDRLEIYTLGTSPPATGETISQKDCHRGPFGWRCGVDVVHVSLNSQQFAAHHMARMLSQHVNRRCTVVQFPHAEVPVASAEHFDLDSTSELAMRAMAAQARADVNKTLGYCGDSLNMDGLLIDTLFREVPPIKLPT